ncbi:MAG: outer membrane beta-barrel protein [Rikenellaceae bacterium]
MKSIYIKLLALLIVLFVSAEGVRAQYMRVSHGFSLNSTRLIDGGAFRHSGYYAQFELTYEQILSQRFSLSFGASWQFGGMPMYSEDDEYTPKDYFKLYRVSIPVSLEYKFRLSDNLRFFVNGGVYVGYNYNFYGDEYDGYGYNDQEVYADYLNEGKSEDDEDYINSVSHKDAAEYCGLNLLAFGVSVGSGFELGNFRFYLQYRTDLMPFAKEVETVDNSQLTNAFNTLSFNAGYRFGGNKLYRTKSKVKAGTVKYPILSSGTTVTKTQPAATTTKPATTTKQKSAVAVAATKTTTPKSTPVVEESPKSAPITKATIIADDSERLNYIRVGLNLAKMTNDYENDYFKNARKQGYYLGYGFHKPFSTPNLYWGMEFALTTRGYMEKWDFSDEGEGEIKFYLSTHSVMVSPFNIGYKYQLPYDLKVDLHLGTFVSYDYAGEFVDKYSNYPEDNSTMSIKDFNDLAFENDYDCTNYERIDAGLIFGFGVWYQDKYNFDISFRNGFVSPFANSSTTRKSRNLMLRLGYSF